MPLTTRFDIVEITGNVNHERTQPAETQSRSVEKSPYPHFVIIPAVIERQALLIVPSHTVNLHFYATLSLAMVLA